jgi:hypothetical protein
MRAVILRVGPDRAPATVVAALRDRFPGAEFGFPDCETVEITAAEWHDPGAELLAFDRRVHAAEDRGPFALEIAGDGDLALLRAATEILLRYQRLVPAWNEHSSTDVFARVLARHAALHDRSKPLVRADHDHALDVWQWTLRLDPNAGLAVQLAALLHDVERLRSEADVRVEHHAPDYQAFKDAHAAGGAMLAHNLLAAAGLRDGDAETVARLVATHERRGQDVALTLLNDADALSFFSLNSAGFLRYYGPEHTAKKVAYTLERMSPRAQAWLPVLRLEPEVARMMP